MTTQRQRDRSHPLQSKPQICFSLTLLRCAALKINFTNSLPSLIGNDFRWWLTPGWKKINMADGSDASAAHRNMCCTEGVNENSTGCDTACLCLLISSEVYLFTLIFLCRPSKRCEEDKFILKINSLFFFQRPLNCVESKELWYNI